jgi:hypothetical protein
MPDHDIPRKYEGEYSYIRLHADGQPGCIVIREIAFDEQAIVEALRLQAGVRKVDFVFAIHGLSSHAAALLSVNAERLPHLQDATRTQLMQLLSDAHDN